MALRTVRLDAESEGLLERVCNATGLTVSAALKRGLASLEGEIADEGRSPIGVYQTLDLGSGGYAIVPARRAKEGVKKAIQRKHRR